MTDKPDDGGQAFPGFGEIFTTDAQGRTAGQRMWGMQGDPGMTLRQWYAGLAMQGILATYSPMDIVPPIVTAKCAINQADALIEELKK